MVELKKVIKKIPFIRRIWRQHLMRSYADSTLCRYHENTVSFRELKGSWSQIGYSSGQASKQALAMGVANDFAASPRFKDEASYKTVEHLLDYASEAAP